MTSAKVAPAREINQYSNMLTFWTFASLKESCGYPPDVGSAPTYSADHVSAPLVLLIAAGRYRFAETLPSGNVKVVPVNTFVIGPDMKLLAEPPLTVAAAVNARPCVADDTMFPLVSVNKLPTVVVAVPLNVALTPVFDIDRL